MTDRKHWLVCTFGAAVEMAAILAVITAMAVHPVSDELTVKSFEQAAFCAVRVFVVLVVAIVVNYKIN